MNDFPFSKAWLAIVAANVVSGLIILALIYHLRGRIEEYWRIGS